MHARSVTEFVLPLMHTSYLSQFYCSYTCISLEEIDGGCSPVFTAMILELVHGKEALVLGDVELLRREEPVVVLQEDLSKCPNKGRVLVLDIVIGGRIICIVWPCSVMLCGDNSHVCV